MTGWFRGDKPRSVLSLGDCVHNAGDFSFSGFQIIGMSPISQVSACEKVPREHRLELSRPGRELIFESQSLIGCCSRSMLRTYIPRYESAKMTDDKSTKLLEVRPLNAAIEPRIFFHRKKR
jgi:hypothetical protein